MSEKDATSRNPFPPSGIVVRKSADPTRPYYLQRVHNDWTNHYFGAHAISGEEFATIEEAEARAEALRG